MYTCTDSAQWQCWSNLAIHFPFRNNKKHFTYSVVLDSTACSGLLPSLWCGGGGDMFQLSFLNESYKTGKLQRHVWTTSHRDPDWLNYRQVPDQWEATYIDYLFNE